MSRQMLSAPFAEVLRSARPELNAQFAHARRLYPELEAQAFVAFVARTLDPWVVATHAIAPERVAAVVAAGYEIGLELVGQRIAGPASRHTEIEQGLVRLLPRAAALAKSDPARAIASIANALHELATTPGAQPGEWIAAMDAAIGAAPDLEHWLRAGQVAAWRAGLAHYRRSALEVAATLPDPLALLALGAAGGNAREIHSRLERDPWFVPGLEPPPIRIGGVCGAFRGFGGLFVEPPRVARTGTELLVRSGEGAWLLVADAFGATLHRATAAEIAGAQPEHQLPPTLLLSDGVLECGSVRLALPATGPITSTAFDGVTLALTTATSHAVVLVAIGAPA